MAKSLLACLDSLADELAAAQRLFVCLDFDGTLTPLVDRPEEAALSPQVRQLLREMMSSPDVDLAFFSGRATSDLHERVGLADVYYAGNHGLQIVGPGLVFVEPHAALRSVYLPLRDNMLRLALARIPGAWVESKGLTTTVHYRLVVAEHALEVEKVVRQAVARVHGMFVITAGAKVWEIRPHMAWNKGKAVLWLREQLALDNALTIYIGDDQTDEDAFAALPQGITVKVGPNQQTHAQYFMQNSTDVTEFLGWLVKQTRSESTPVE